jgi:transketolase N-terminal domain/subunit
VSNFFQDSEKVYNLLGNSPSSLSQFVNNHSQILSNTSLSNLAIHDVALLWPSTQLSENTDEFITNYKLFDTLKSHGFDVTEADIKDASEAEKQLQFTTPDVKLYYPEPFIASPSFNHEDIWFIHILHYNY